ncbi:MAG: ABC transporter substrate-binding protein [Dehalococcoidia bacterium]|nr:ABC transporter substrate-binding protein [Dehalococcoidia bacterium]
MLKGILKRTVVIGLVLFLVLGGVLIAGCTDEVDEDTPQGQATSSPVLGDSEEARSTPTAVATVDEKPAPSQPVSYTIADSTGDWGYPSPYTHYSRGPGYIRMSFVFDTLVWKDEMGKFVPALAEEWQYLEDENAYVFKLRDNVTWHDGEKFTAEDVAFTVEYVKEHPMPFTTLIGPSGIRETEIIDDYTIKISLEQLYAPFLNDIAGTLVMLPQHIWEEVVVPEEFTDAKAVVGTGPYMLVDYSKEHGTYLYKAFPDYYLGKPAVEELKLVKIGEQMIPAALKEGSVDYGGVSPDIVGEMEKEGFAVVMAPRGWNAKLTINHNKEPLSTREFRQALAYAIDRDGLVEITQRGHGAAGSAGMIPPDSEWYNPNIEQYAYNPEKARELLEGMGYQLEDGWFVKDGEPLELELLTQSRYGFVEVGEFIQQQLESIGIKIELRCLEGKSLDSRVDAWDFDLSVYGHGGLYEPSILNKVITGSGFNSARYEKNEILNQLLEEQRQEMNPVKRKELVQQIQAVYADVLPALTLYYPNWYSAHNSRVAIFYTPGGVASGIPIALNKLAFMQCEDK